MAEIDNDFQIELFGGLDISKSKSKINADIETLKKQIKELEISAKIDANVSKNLEKQLNNLSIKLSDVKVEPKALTKMVGEINNALRGIQISNINIGNGSNNLPNQAKQAGQQVGEIIGKEAQKAIDNVLSDSIGKAFKIRPNVSNNFKKEIENLVSDWTNGKGSVKDIKIQTRTSYDEGLDANVEKLQQATVTYRNELDEVIKKTIALRQTGTSVDLKGNESPVYGFVEVASQYSKSLDEINTKTDTFIEKQKKAVSQAQIALNSAQSGYQDKNASKPIKSNEHVTALEQQYSVVKTAINNLGSASKSNFTDMQNEVDKQIAKLQDMVSVFRNAETVATSLRSKDIGTVKEQYSSKLDVLVGKMKSSGVYTDGFKSGADNLKNVLSNAVDASGLVTFLNGLDKLDAGFKRAKASADEFNKAQKVKINVSGLESKLADLERLNPEIKNFKTQIAGADVTIDSLLSDLSKINTQGDFSVINTKFKAFRDAAQAAGYAVNDVVINSKTIDNIKSATDGTGKISYANQIQEIEKKFRDLGFTESEVANQTSDLRAKHQDLLDVIDSKNFSSDTEHNQAIIEADKQRAKELNKVSNAYKSLKTDATQFYNLDKQNKLSNDIQNWLSKNTAASKSARASLEAYFKELSEGRVTAERLKYIETELKKIDTQQRGMGKLGLAFKDQWTQAVDSFKTWLSASAAVMLVVSKTKEAVTELKEIDTILTEISKTNDKLSKSDLKNIGNNAFETASKYGKKATDYLSGVQEASRAGYENAENIAELSTAAQGAGDMTAELANSYIIATDKAYGMEGSVQKLTQTLDGANEITNHNAVNMTELAEGMKVVGSQAASSQISVEETTAALGTLIAVTQQGGSQMGNAFKGILMNLRQVTGEVDGEEIDQESLTKYEKACEALGVSLSEVKDGAVSLKEPMQILKELSAEYTKLDKDDAKRANLLSAIGGKYRANALNAILENWSTYENMLQQYADGDGSMAEEAEKTANSLEGSLNKLSNTWTDTVQNILDSDTLNSGVKVLNTVLDLINKITDKLGLFGTAGLTIGTILGVKNVGRANYIS
jgi:TP901 family phage tail tape measure protein